MPINQPLVRRLFKFRVLSSGKLLQVLLTLGVLIQGLMLTGSVWRYTHNEAQRTALQKFERRTNRTKYLIENRLQNYFNALHAGQGLFAAQQTTNRAEWKAFVEALNLPERYPGINGLGFIRYVSNDQKTIYEAQLRDSTNGYPKFAIKPAGTRSDYFVIEYIEPSRLNSLALGLDIKSEARRRVAAERARDTGQIAATQRIVLLQDREKKSGLLILLPIYKAGMPTQTVAERRRALLGFVYAPLKTRDLIHEALAYESNGVLNLKVYENHELLYETDTEFPTAAQRQIPLPQGSKVYQSTETLYVAGQRWDLHFVAQSNLLSQSERQLPNLILASGLLITVLLTAIVSSLASARGRALARNQAIIAAIPDLLVRLKRDGTCIDFISPMGAKTGTFIPIQKHISEVLPPPLLQHQVQRIERALATGELQVWEHQLMKEGRLCDEEVRLAPCGKDEVLIIVRDITERKQAEVERREVMIALENAVSGISRLDAQGRYQFVNRSYASTAGYQPEEMIGMSWQQTVHPDDLEKLTDAYQQMKQTGRAEVEAKGIRKDGSIFYKELVIISIYDEHHQFTGHHCFIRDITERKQARIALEKELLRSKALFKSSFDGIVVLNQPGNVVEVNQSFAQMLGYSLEEVATLNVSDWDARWTKSELLQILQEIKPYRHQFETLHRRKDGSLYEVEISVSRVEVEDEFLKICICRNISDRKRIEFEHQQAEAALLQSESTKQAIIQAIPDLLIRMRADGSYVEFISNSILNVVEPAPRHPDTNVYDVLPPNLARLRLDHTQEALQSGVTQVYEHQIVIAGEQYNEEIRIVPLLQNEVLVMVRNITDRKQAEVELQSQKAFLQQVIDTVPSSIFVKDNGGKFVIVNQSAASIYGVTIAEMLGKRDSDLSQDIAQAKEFITQNQLVIQSAVPITLPDQQIKDRSGHLRWYQTTISSLVDINGQTKGIIGNAIDISARREAEVALKLSEERLKLVIEASGDGLWDWNIETGEVYCSPRYQEMLGYLPGELVMDSKGWEQTIHPDDKAVVLERLQAYLQDSSVKYTLDYQIRCRSGEWKWITDYGKVVNRDPEGNPLRMIGAYKDISDRKHKEFALQQAVAAAEAANLAKSLFLANMSHELRTPLNVILGFAQVMAHDTTLTPNQLEDLQTIRRSGDHLLSLINDVLDLSKIEAGHCALEETEFDLVASLQTLRTMTTKWATFNQLQLEFDLAPEIPQFVTADEQKLRQILLNLLSNAIKFTKQGSVTLRVSLGEPTSEKGEEQSGEGELMTLCFEVIDTGVGIAPEEQKTIFDAFVQAEAGKKSISGTGLGLAISRKLLQLMNGDISIQSIPNVGTTFTFTVPVGSTSMINIQPEQHDCLVIGLAPGQPHRRILVVDDQEENRLLLIRLLTRLGLEIREATNGQDAICIWQEWQPELIWMDIRMPGLDGCEVTQQIRAMECGQASIIIALTAQASQSDRAFALAAGCNDYISTPCREETLFLKLKEYLGLEYLYAADLPLSEHQPIERSPTPSGLPDPIDATLLASLPTEWLHSLEDAAVCGNDRAIATLASELAPNLASLSTELIELAEKYQFEKILELIHDSSPQTSQ